MAEPQDSSQPPQQAATKSGRPASRRLFMRQPNMLRVLYALVPVAAAGVYFFGWRVAALLAVCTAAGLATEWVTSRKRGASISIACFVTCWLFALSLPPTAPLWLGVVGAIVAILFGKEVFGGFGRNFANPAIVGRTFVYVAFPGEMTAAFVPVFRGFPGGLVHWSLAGAAKLPDYLASSAASAADAVTQATPMLARSRFGEVTPTVDLLTGSIGGGFPGEYGAEVLAAGSIGEVSAILCILAGAYLLITRTANWRLMLSPLLGAAVANVLFRNVAGQSVVPPLEFTMLSGAMLYAAVFMVTEPVSAPKKRPAMLIYGALIGLVIVLLRWKGQFIGAAGFAILLGNIVAPLIDLGVEAVGKRKAAAAAGKGEGKAR